MVGLCVFCIFVIINQIKAKKMNKTYYPTREIFNAICYLLKTGCQWRMLPLDFPKWQLVYYYYSQWKYDGTFEEMNEEQILLNYKY